VRRDIIGLALLASVLALALFGVPLAGAVVQYTVAYERVELETVADTAAIAVAADLVRADPLPPLPAAPEGTAVAVFDHHGVRVAGTGPDRADTQVRAALDGGVAADSRDGRIVVAIPVTHDGDVIGAVRAAGRERSVHQQVALAWGAMLALAALAVGAVWLVARRRAARLARPLEDLAVLARRLGEGDFSARSRPVQVAEIDAVGSALNHSADRLDRLVARERAFSAEASHQLRTPLTGLRFRLEAALDQPGQDLRRAIVGAVAAADRLERTIDDLLALAREHRGGTAEPLDVAALLEEVAESFGPPLVAGGRRLEVRTGEHLPTVVASPAAVGQVLAVLVDNAVTHGVGTVTVTARETSDALAVDVGDEGEARASEAALFDGRATSEQGHGIGLGLARRLAEAEGGRLRLSSASPTTFTLLLPARPAGPAGPTGPAAPLGQLEPVAVPAQRDDPRQPGTTLENA
jgi:signal transduction histidine kinase